MPTFIYNWKTPPKKSKQKNSFIIKRLCENKITKLKKANPIIKNKSTKGKIKRKTKQWANNYEAKSLLKRKKKASKSKTKLECEAHLTIIATKSISNEKKKNVKERESFSSSFRF